MYRSTFASCFRIAIKKEEELIIDSEPIYDTTITGGRVGMLVFAQPGAIFSKLRYECKERSVHNKK